MKCPKCNSLTYESLSRKSCSSKTCKWEYVFAFEEQQQETVKDNPYFNYDGKGCPIDPPKWYGK
jgi:hypothetical protein